MLNLNIENIIIDKKELGRLNGTGKRVWSSTKKKTVKVDEISKTENAIFANDIDLARLVKAKQILDEKITTHIDQALTKNRGYDATEQYENRNLNTIRVLKEVEHELHSLTGLDATDNLGTEKEEHFKLDYVELAKKVGCIIEELEEGE